MELGLSIHSTVYKMSYSTRSRSSTRPAREGQKWTVTEERDLIRMSRHLQMSENKIAVVLNRSVEGVRFRLLKIFAEHLTGFDDAERGIGEVSDWLVPIDSKHPHGSDS